MGTLKMARKPKSKAFLIIVTCAGAYVAMSFMQIPANETEFLQRQTFTNVPVSGRFRSFGLAGPGCQCRAEHSGVIRTLIWLALSRICAEPSVGFGQLPFESDGAFPT